MAISTKDILRIRDAIIGELNPRLRNIENRITNLENKVSKLQDTTIGIKTFIDTEYTIAQYHIEDHEKRITLIEKK